MQSRSRIAVAGASGRVGRHIVDVLAERGHDPVAMSRASGVDVISGDGLAAALDGAEWIVDAATGPDPDQDAATAFFTTSARNLQGYGERAGVRGIVVVSIIGTDRFHGGYGAAKVAHEQTHAAGPVPARIVRAAQFHEFVGQLVDWGTQGDVAYVQKARMQLVSARTVAETLVDVATDAIAFRAPYLEVAGPREETLVHAATLLASRRGYPLKIEEMSDATDDGAVYPTEDRDVYEGGGLLPSPGAILGGPTFEEWLATTA